MTTTTSHTETYRGRQISLAYEPAIDSETGYRRAALWMIALDGRSYYGWSMIAGDVTADAAWAKLAPRVRRSVDEEAEDAENMPRMMALAGCDASSANVVDRPAQVGDTVRLHSRGKARLALVVKVTRTGTVTVSYTTPSNPGRVTRKTAKAGQYDVVS